MSSNVQHEAAWPIMHVSSVSLQNIHKDDDTDKLEGSKACAAHHATSLTERDYIGMSTTSSTISSSNFHNLMHLDPSKCSDARDKEPEFRDTELRLGIGPSEGETSALHAPPHGGNLVQPVPHLLLYPQNQTPKHVEDGSKLWNPCASVNGSVGFLQSYWPWEAGLACGRFGIPVPKVTMVPAKRPYLEGTGENNKALMRTVAMNSNTPVASHLSSSEERAPHTANVHKEDANRNKAPVVGWPPVRSFRKNTVQSAAGLEASKGRSASSDVHNHEDASKAGESVTGRQNKGTPMDALFVKARLDGVRICRKVDLTSYSSYESLKSALQEMFQGFVGNDNAKLDLLHEKNYVLTHEDKDGDWMLVGDVPWCMFVTTVKSLRIIKAVDAVGFGKKVCAKA